MTARRSRGIGTSITITFFRQGLGLVVSLGLAALIARVLGPDGQGKYALGILLPTLLVTFCNLGVPTANVYFLGRGDVSVRAALRTSLRMSLVLSALGGVAGAIVIHFFSDRWFPGVPRAYLWITLASYPFALLQSFLVSLLQGRQDFHRYNLVLLAQPALTLLFTAGVIFVLGAGVRGALAAYVVSIVAGLIVAVLSIRPHLGAGSAVAPDREMERYAARCIGYGWQTQIANNLAFLSYRADMFLINYFLSPAATGLYVVAVAIAEKIWMLSQAVTSVTLPRLSELHVDEERRRRLTPLTTRVVFVVSAAIAIVLFIFAGPLIIGVFGREYSDSIGALRWLLPGVVALAVARGVSIDFAARGRVDLNLYVAVIVVASNIGANIYLIPRYGIDGSAMATTMSYTLNLVIKLVMYQRISGNPWHSLVAFGRADAAVIKGKLDSLKGGR